MATDIFSQWDQVRSIMDNYQARIQRLDSETEAMHIELGSIEQRGATLLKAIDAAAKQRIKLVEAMEVGSQSSDTKARDISQGVLDSMVPAQAAINPPATAHAMEMPSARKISQLNLEPRCESGHALLNSEDSASDEPILPATPTSLDDEDNNDDDDNDEDNDSDDAAFAAMAARTANPEASVKRKRDSSPIIGGKDAPFSSNQTVEPPHSKKGRKLQECIHPTFPTVVSTLDGFGWIELRCGHCSSNTVLQRQTLLKGIAGFKQHYRTRHHDKLGADEELNSTHILEHAAYHYLSQEEATGILAGDQSAYHVPRVVGDVKKCTKRSKAKDEVAKG
ncbi:hypothetical protein LTS10_002380 [Elasticomyces elasticus]|nr:hypothetical protein LTS10_002380 [Elasticomyces elasticus]